MNKRILFLLFSILSLSIRAEVITGNCYILDKQFGENQFQLNPGTIVDCGAPKNGWCMVLYKAFIEKKYVYDGIKIYANAKLRNEKGKVTGKVYKDMNPYRTILENDTCFVMEIAGFIEVCCIEDTSIVEHELEKIYFKKDSLLNISVFNKHLKDFKYTQWISKDKLYAFLLKETDIINPKPGLRVVIIFDKDKAVAILHNRPLKIGKFESVTNTQRYSLIYLWSFAESYKKQIAEIFLRESDNL
ncbi:MAG: hypothetical protein WCO54_02540 [Bacteroidota bacterium]